MQRVRVLLCVRQKGQRGKRVHGASVRGLGYAEYVKRDRNMRNMSKKTDICGFCEKKPTYAEYVKRDLNMRNMSKETTRCGTCQKRPKYADYVKRDRHMRNMSKET